MYLHTLSLHGALPSWETGTDPHACAERVSSRGRPRGGYDHPGSLRDVPPRPTTAPGRAAAAENPSPAARRERRGGTVRRRPCSDAKRVRQGRASPDGTISAPPRGGCCATWRRRRRRGGDDGNRTRTISLED